jgi:hypothetical protein
MVRVGSVCIGNTITSLVCVYVGGIAGNFGGVYIGNIKVFYRNYYQTEKCLFGLYDVLNKRHI